MGPERIIESEVPMLGIGVLWVIKTRHVTSHIDAQSAVQGSLPLIEGSDSDSNLDTHSKTIIKHQK